jgi:alanyl-tRNA synthetase
MTSKEIQKLFLDFFKDKRHTIVPSSSLIPDDPSVLLTTAGMQQFKKYFTGERDALKDFGSKNVASIQKCFRTSDIDEVGDKTHLTFFEMLGHFSFGDYFKRETIEWTYQLLTEIFGISPKRISAGVFGGDELILFDKESFEAWSKLIPQKKIRRGTRLDNFWGPAGTEGPCGACNEVYVDNIEVATLVFMEYYGTAGGTLKPLSQKGVDVGWGLERLAAILQGTDDVFETDIFQSLITKIRELAPALDNRLERIFCDHLRAIAFLISDGLRPSNKEAGYILRRLWRRLLAYQIKYGLSPIFSFEIIKLIPASDPQKVIAVLEEESNQFQKVIARGLKELESCLKINGQKAFYLYESFGLPLELIKELAPGKVAENLEADFQKEFKKHQEISRTTSAGMFRSGLIDANEQTVKLHTATHLLMESLRRVLGNQVTQKGSNINAERLRLDFSHPEKLTPEQIKKIEDMINQKIKEDLPVEVEEMGLAEAKKQSAIGVFESKYGERVKVYTIGNFSKEICAGPHVKNTAEIGQFKILKEEAVGAGIRRIKAIIV